MCSRKVSHLLSVEYSRKKTASVVFQAAKKTFLPVIFMETNGFGNVLNEK